MAKPKLKTTKRHRDRLKSTPKLKKHSSTKKRFKVTGTGLVVASHTHVQKNKRRKSAKQVAGLRKVRLISKGHAKLMKKGNRLVSF
jgi:large subunit ribosomal protein L35